MVVPKMIVIVGPTAVGKTKLSIDLAKKIETEIISADSMQIYQYMDIGTAKIKAEETLGIKHHLINIVKPNENFSVSEFQKKAYDIIYDLNNKDKIPIIVGGSGLYVNALIYNLDFGKVKSNKKIRDYYYNIYQNEGTDALYELLLSKDSDAANNIHKNNIKRVIRALEVCDVTGKKFSQLNNHFREKTNQFDCIIIGLDMDRRALYNRINLRVDQMMEEGLIEEVSQLLNDGYSSKLTAMQGLGYKEIVSYLNGLTTKEETIRILKRNTRRFAKRQFTWFSKDDRIKWFNVELNKYDSIFQDIYNYIKLKI